MVAPGLQEVHTRFRHEPLWQSASAKHVLPLPHWGQVPPQSKSVSVPFLIASVQDEAATQAPFVQMPEGQTLPHVPQLVASVWVAVHARPHNRGAVVGQQSGLGAGLAASTPPAPATAAAPPSAPPKSALSAPRRERGPANPRAISSNRLVSTVLLLFAN